MFYQNFIGIDIGKATFVAACHGQKTTQEYANNLAGITSFINDNKALLPDALVVLETTGGYEQLLLDRLTAKGFRVHRANTRKVKNFVRSYSDGAKTDRLDALALARYGAERQASLGLYEPPSAVQRQLTELARRRLDLKKMAVVEKKSAASSWHDIFSKKHPDHDPSHHRRTRQHHSANATPGRTR